MCVETVIVGGGPAGLSAAKILAENNVRVVLVEPYPGRIKPCGGGLTRRCQLLLQLVFPGYIDLIENVINEVMLVHSRSTYLLRLERIFVTVRREILDYKFMRHVVDECGVELVQDRVRKLLVSRDKVVLQCNSQDIEAKVVLGCDGVYSAVRRELGMTMSFSPYAVRAYGRYRGRPDVAILDFRLSRKSPGYLWIFPLRDGANIGYGELTSEPKSGVTVRNKLILGAKLYEINEIYDIRGHALPGEIYLPSIDMSPRNVLLAGDAAGLIDYSTGEGITFAVLSGILAALSVLKRPSHPLETYLNMISSIIGDLKLSRRVILPIKYRVDDVLDRCIRNILTRSEPVSRVLRGRSSYYEEFKRLLKLKPLVTLLKNLLKPRELQQLIN